MVLRQQQSNMQPVFPSIFILLILRFPVVWGRELRLLRAMSLSCGLTHTALSC